MTSRGLRRTAAGILPWVALAPFLLPFGWMLLTALKNNAANIAYPPVLVFRPTFANFTAVFAQNTFGKYLVNSLIIGVGSTALALALGLPAAYSAARRHRVGFALPLLIVRMVPGITFLVPWYMMFRSAGLLDTYLALILTHLIVSLPIVVWLMIGFFEDIPAELGEASRVDGCSQAGSFVRIALPLTLPGTVAAGIVAFIFSWNNFLFSLILSGNHTTPLPVAVFSFMSYGLVDWGGLSAAATVVLAPVLILTLMSQRLIAEGLTTGALKG
ncbi:MAG: carbohydrate ABC transporter permease [bacterium]